MDEYFIGSRIEQRSEQIRATFMIRSLRHGKEKIVALRRHFLAADVARAVSIIRVDDLTDDVEESAPIGTRHDLASEKPRL